MDLVRQFPADVIGRVLQDWSWLIGPTSPGPLEPVASTLFGDVFLRGADGVWFLDMVEGSFERRWPDVAALETELGTTTGQDTYLMAGLAVAAAARDAVPDPTQVLVFKIPPVLGGSLDVDNLDVEDYEVASALAGQLHRQVKDVPPGTPISGVTIADGT